MKRAKEVFTKLSINISFSFDLVCRDVNRLAVFFSTFYFVLFRLQDEVFRFEEKKSFFFPSFASHLRKGAMPLRKLLFFFCSPDGLWVSVYKFSLVCCQFSESCWIMCSTVFVSRDGKWEIVPRTIVFHNFIVDISVFSS